MEILSLLELWKTLKDYANLCVTLLSFALICLTFSNLRWYAQILCLLTISWVIIKSTHFCLRIFVIFTKTTSFWTNTTVKVPGLSKHEYKWIIITLPYLTSYTTYSNEWGLNIEVWIKIFSSHYCHTRLQLLNLNWVLLRARSEWDLKSVVTIIPPTHPAPGVVLSMLCSVPTPNVPPIYKVCAVSPLPSICFSPTLLLPQARKYVRCPLSYYTFFSVMCAPM